MKDRLRQLLHDGSPSGYFPLEGGSDQHQRRDSDQLHQMLVHLLRHWAPQGDGEEEQRRGSIGVPHLVEARGGR